MMLKSLSQLGNCCNESSLFTKRQNFRPFQIESFCRRQNNMILKLKFVSERIENILGKRENAGYQHFLLFPKCFQKPPSLGSLKVGIVF